TMSAPCSPQTCPKVLSTNVDWRISRLLPCVRTPPPPVPPPQPLCLLLSTNEQRSTRISLPAELTKIPAPAQPRLERKLESSTAIVEASSEWKLRPVPDVD